MNCDDDYVNKPEKYKCLGNTIDGNIFSKHNDQIKPDRKMRLSGLKKTVIITNSINKTVLLPLCDNKCD
jgi:hypothetical protein